MATKSKGLAGSLRASKTTSKPVGKPVLQKADLAKEISRDIPAKVKILETKSTVPLLTAYGCVLLERDTGRSYIYTAVNLKTGHREVIARRGTPLTTSGVEAIVEKIRLSGVAGAGRLQADRHLSERASLEKCRDILAEVFTEVLPQHGFGVRKEQLSLSYHILEAIGKRIISLAESEVGTGKTLAYLVPAIIAKRARLNGYWNMSFYTGSPYVIFPRRLSESAYIVAGYFNVGKCATFL